MRNQKIISVIFLSFFGFIMVSLAPSFAYQSSDSLDGFSPLRFPTLKLYHQQGLSGDRSQIPAMIHGLQTQTDITTRKTIILTLVRLHAIEALPALDKVIQSKPDLPVYSNFLALSARAQLLAQEEPTPHDQVVRFFQELGEPPQQVTAILQKYKGDGIYPAKEIYAEEQLAEMIYHGPTFALLADPLIAQVDFSRCSDAAIKVEMSQLPPEQQRQILIERLAHAKICDTNQWDMMQILVDLNHEQTAAEVTTKLQEMAGDSKSYTLDGFRCLFPVLDTCEDSAHLSPIWNQFKNFPDLKIRDEAQYAYVGHGLSGRGVIEYGY